MQLFKGQPELDLQVNPGSSSTGYVSNVEGVLNRFLEVMNTVLRGLQLDIEDQHVQGNKVDLTQTSKEIVQLELMISNVKNAGLDSSVAISLEFLDPHGHSMILDESAVERELTDEEITELPTGPDPAVFSFVTPCCTGGVSLRSVGHISKSYSVWRTTSASANPTAPRRPPQMSTAAFLQS